MAKYTVNKAAVKHAPAAHRREAVRPQQRAFSPARRSRTHSSNHIRGKSMPSGTSGSRRGVTEDKGEVRLRVRRPQVRPSDRADRLCTARPSGGTRTSNWPRTTCCSTWTRRAVTRSQQSRCLRSAWPLGCPRDRTRPRRPAKHRRQWAQARLSGWPATQPLHPCSYCTLSVWTERDWHMPPQLAQTHRVYALDLRGHGASDFPGQYSFELMRDDVIGFLDAVEVGRCVLIGHSMGERYRFWSRSRSPLVTTIPFRPWSVR